MSTYHNPSGTKKTRDTSEERLSDTQIEITSHARLRFLQRVDATAPNPAQRLRKMFRTGAEASSHPDVDTGRARRSGDVLVVYRGSVTSPKIITVLRDRTGGA